MVIMIIVAVAIMEITMIQKSVIKYKQIVLTLSVTHYAVIM